MEILNELLEKDKFSVSTIHYPEGLGTGRYGHYVNFYIHTPQQSQYKQTTISKNVGTVDGQFKNTTVFGSNAVQSIANDAKKSLYNRFNLLPNVNKTTGNIDYNIATNPIGVSKEFIKSAVENFTGISDISSGINEGVKNVMDFLVTGGKTQLTDVISLYMPDTVSMSQQANYSNESLTKALGVVGLGGAAINSAADMASNFDSFSKTFKGLANDPLALEVAGHASTIATRNNGDEMMKILLNASGYALNPQLQVIFNEMGFRTFQFDFLFSPKSEKEAEAVRNIIKLFKFHQAPEVGTKALGRYYTVPSTFDIEYMLNGKRNENLHRISTCVLTTLFVDYAPVGWVTYEDGMPVQTRLTLAFQETEIMTKNRINDNF